MADPRIPIPGSERAAPAAERSGACDPQERAEVSVYLKCASGPPAGGGVFHDRETLHASRAQTLEAAIKRLTAFAEAHGLSISERDPGRRLVKLQGTVEKLQSAFGTQLHHYTQDGRSFRGRSGHLTAPADVAGDIEAVLGLDQRPIATPKNRRLADPDAAAASYLPNQVAKLYGFPDATGQGQCVALIELGGGFTDSDTQAAFKAMGLTPPKLTAIPVSGGSNAPGGTDGADGEVALDIQVAGGAAPDAAYAVYFAPNTDQGFVDAISQAAHDTTNKPSVMSISWGSAESLWTQQSVTAMTSALQDAADLGVSVFAASGDNLATDGVDDGKAHVDFPASSPLVVGCGGVRLEGSGTTISSETVWNSEGGGTGGGISDLFPVPAYQTDIALPASANGASHRGRGVPDVAADADPETGYRVIVDGQAQVVGGTSAAAPLWAGLFALINQQAGKLSGQPHATLYANPSAFRDITSGNNTSDGIGYSAAKGWDACTGLGAPNGTAVAKLFG
ncbi:protease pro-enzyme activation domain-containing protein [Caulobacter sp. S45]|uniref:S53 family peptidase n=1 Tax=Caulobacter sp. S45 TaxID=1641861 RepID=UPI00131C30C2|nr:S53 family peptidase [Caulobacter sp. S45]